MDILQAWRNGSQIVSLNWQTYDRAMQINEAMFVGSPGWIPKPAQLQGKEGKTIIKYKLVGEIVGVSSCAFTPCVLMGRLLKKCLTVFAVQDPEKASSLLAYIRAQLFHSTKDLEWRSKTAKCPGVSWDIGADVMWNEQFEWQYDADELAFLRYKLGHSSALRRPESRSLGWWL
jgi:phosphatidylinositol phospholipase C delta